MQQIRLNSWKEIASYLERDERTVKRWEKSRALPVRRLPGGRGRVFAFCSEIDAWQVSSAHAESETGLLPASEQSQALPEHGAGTATSAPLDMESESGVLATPEHPTIDPAEDASQPHWIKPHWLRPRWVVGVLAAGVTALLLAGATAARHARTPVAQAAAVHKPPVEALNLYLNGRYYWNKRTPADLDQALSDFQAATAIDPAYAEAWAGIADCYGLSTEFAEASPQSAYPRMLDAAQRAVALSPNSAEAHRALGFVLFYWNWDRAGSSREFQRAIELDPRDATTYHWYGNVLMQSQQLPEALHMLDQARVLDPASPAILADRGLALQVGGDVTRAAEVWSTLEHSDPSYLPPHWYLANTDLMQHNIAGYLSEVREIARISHSPTDQTRVTLLQKAELEHGDQGVLDAAAKATEDSATQLQAGYVAAAWTLDAANRREDALRLLQEAYAHRDPAFPTIANPNSFLDLQATPLYLDLKAKSLLPFPQPAPSHVANLGAGPLSAK